MEIVIAVVVIVIAVIAIGASPPWPFVVTRGISVRPRSRSRD